MFIDALIGGLGGIISRTCVAPIELNRIQRQNYFIPNANLTDVYKKEGIRFFWKGNGVNCIRIFPQIAINYSVFRQSKNTLLRDSFIHTNMLNNEDHIQDMKKIFKNYEYPKLKDFIDYHISNSR